MMLDQLERFVIFEGLTPEDLEAIMRRCQITTVRKGEKVFESGKDAQSLFLVCSGRIELRFKVVYFNGLVEVLFESIGAGKVCGWSAMIPPHIYTLSAYATEDSELFQIKQADLEELCEANTQLGYVVMKNIAQIVVERYEIAWKMLQGEIQQDLKKKENKNTMEG